MHELPIIERILNITLKHARDHRVTRIAAIKMQIGQLSDLEEEWIQHYFQYLSRGTLAEGARIEIEWRPIVMECSNCRVSFEADKKNMAGCHCPHCGGKDSRLLSGREYRIKEMEAE